jgi:hypothetical protein
MGTVTELGIISFKDILLVPVIMVCAIAGTVGIIWLIRRFFLKKNINKDSQ